MMPAILVILALIVFVACDTRRHDRDSHKE